MSEDVRVCASCKHLVGRRDYFDTAEKWRCHHVQNVVRTHTDLVTGKTVYTLRWESCYSARAQDAGCGQAGKWWEGYEAPQLHLAGGSKMTADSLLAELEQLPKKE